MLDLGLTKLALIAAVALIVVGPKRLPTLARALGTLFGRMQRYLQDLHTQVTQIESNAFSSILNSSAEESTQTIYSNTEDFLKNKRIKNWHIKENWYKKYSFLANYKAQNYMRKRYLLSGAARIKRFTYNKTRDKS